MLWSGVYSGERSLESLLLLRRIHNLRQLRCGIGRDDGGEHGELWCAARPTSTGQSKVGLIPQYTAAIWAGLSVELDWFNTDTCLSLSSSSDLSPGLCVLLWTWWLFRCTAGVNTRVTSPLQLAFISLILSAFLSVEVKQRREQMMSQVQEVKPRTLCIR